MARSLVKDWNEPKEFSIVVFLIFVMYPVFTCCKAPPQGSDSTDALTGLVAVVVVASAMVEGTASESDPQLQKQC